MSVYGMYARIFESESACREWWEERRRFEDDEDDLDLRDSRESRECFEGLIRGRRASAGSPLSFFESGLAR